MNPVTRRIVALLAAAMVTGPALAWKPETRIDMADQAVRLMPASLRVALEKHRRELMRGVLGPLVDEDAPEHRAPWAEGRLDQALQAEAAELIAALEQPTRFGEVAERFGRLAHFVMDAGFPPGVSDSDGDARFQHFAWFCEDRRAKFPLVFYGHDDDAWDGQSFAAFAATVMERARAEDRMLARAYAAAGDPPAPEAFDDRSVPFAVASLSYSRCVTDVVRAWLSAWRSAGGDLGRTPYRKAPQPAE